MARARKRNKPVGPKEFDPSRWAHVVFAAFAGISAWVFGNLVENVWGWGWAQWPATIPRPNEFWAQGLGAIIGISLIVYLWSREQHFKFISDVATEVSQIVWPTRAETRAATVVVVIITLICSGILWLMDTFWSQATSWLYEL